MILTINSQRKLHIQTNKKINNIILFEKKINFSVIQTGYMTEELSFHELLNIDKINLIFSDSSILKVDLKLNISEAEFSASEINIKKNVVNKLWNFLDIDNYDTLLYIYNYYFKPKSNYRYYADNYNKIPLQTGTVLIESLNCNDISGSMLKLAESFSNNGFKVSVVYNNTSRSKILQKLTYYNIDAELLYRYSKEYYTTILSSEYLLTDSTFSRFMICNPKQTYINTWHGTPFKTMGKKIDNYFALGDNIQRNIHNSTIFLQNCNYGKDVMEKSFSASNIIVQGSPRIDYYFEKNRNEQIRKELNIPHNTNVLVFVPTWRGTSFSTQEFDIQNINIINWLEQISDKYLVFYKPHQIISHNVATDFPNINIIPEKYDVNDFLNIADVMVTDYSSILFDHAISNKKILLYTPDFNEYQQTRGFNFDINILPFERFNTEKELISFLNVYNPQRDNIDYTDFNKIYNPHESGVSTEKLMSFITSRKSIVTSNRKSILLYGGSFQTNGITSAFKGLIANLENISDIDIYIFIKSSTRKNIQESDYLNTLNDNIKIINSPNGIIMSQKELLLWKRLLSKKKIKNHEFKLIDKMFFRETQRLFGNLKFDYAINFSGYDIDVTGLLANLDTRFIIFIHSDMEREWQLKRNHHKQALLYYYKKAYKVVAIDSILKTSIQKNYYNGSNIDVCRNSIDIKSIQLRSLEQFEYNNNDKEILEDKNCIKFINIGRFSPEKGQERLLEAYNRIKMKFPKKKFHLFLIGTEGTTYHNIVNLSQSIGNISIYTNINPFPILKDTDLFILSSFYEGLPMTFFEALSLNIPILSCDIPSTTNFLNKGYGDICDNSVDGIEAGIERFLTEKKKDYYSIDKYNEEAFKDFMKLIEGEV